MSRVTFSVPEAREVFEEAVGAAFLAVAHGMPHPDDDQEGDRLPGFQRAFVLALLGLFGEGLARRSVELELWPTVDDFFAQLDDGEVSR